jgi:hypothetical protein
LALQVAEVKTPICIPGQFPSAVHRSRDGMSWRTGKPEDS